MTKEDGGWDDLFDPAPEPDPVEYAPASVEQPVSDETSASDEADALTLFGSPDQFHVAWQHWNGMPEFHMDDLRPESTLVVKFRTAEDRAAFAKLLGREIRKEESRGIWYPNIVIAHFWDKRYRDADAAVVDDTPILSEADEPDDEAEALTDEQLKQLAEIEEGSPA